MQRKLLKLKNRMSQSLQSANTKTSPFYMTTDTVKDLIGVSLISTQEYITHLGLDNSGSNLIPANTVIVATRMAVGKAVRFDKEVAINQDLRALFPRDNLHTDFLHYWILSKKEELLSIATGTTVKGIRQEVLKGLDIVVPPYKEQVNIAEKFEDVDFIIQAEQTKPDQLKRVKKDLMADLLTGKKRVIA